MSKSIEKGPEAASRPRGVGAALAVAVVATLALALSQCTTLNNGDTPTGCVAYRPDAGIAGAQCAVEWACNSGSQHYEIVCTLMGDNYVCTCGTDTSSLTKSITLNPFSCDLNGGALIAASSCGYMLEM